MKKAIVYLRVSTEEQAEKGFSIPAQREECIRMALQLGCSEKDIYVFSDEGVSGSVIERPRLMASLELLRKGGIDYYITMDTSRLSRNVSHQLMLVDEIKKSGTDLIFIRNNYQDNPEGRFQITIMAAVDEYERARLKLRTEMGKRAKAKQHLLTHNPGIYGYSFDVKSDSLYINEEQARIIRLMYDWLIEEDMGASEISDRLNEIGIPSPRMKLWNRVTVRRILSNRSYTGTLYIRRYDTREYHLNKYKKPGEKVKVSERPRDEWIDIGIPQIIDESTWEKAQCILKKRKRKAEVNGNNAEYMLSSLLTCARCGSRLHGKHVKSSGKDYIYYMCSGRSSEKCCDLSLINRDELERIVWECIKKRIIESLRRGCSINGIFEKVKAFIRQCEEMLLYELENAKAERLRLITIYQKGYIMEEEMQNKLCILDERIRDLETSLEEKRNSKTYSNDNINKIFDSKNIYNNIEELLNQTDEKSRKHIISSLLVNIKVNEEELIIISRI